MIRILFVIPYQEGEEVVKKVLAERAYKKNVQYETIVAKVGERLAISEDRADAIVVRGYTASAMHTSLPKIELRVTGFDIVRAVNKCIEKYGSKKIKVVGTFNMVYGADSIQDIYKGMEISCHMLEKEEKLEETLKSLRQAGVEAFIGGNSLYEKAEEMGIPAVLLEFGRESVNKCVDEAIRAVEIQRHEQEKRVRIQTIMDYAFEGILSTDKEGMITMVNQYAQNMLGSCGQTLIGKKIVRFLPALQLKEVLGSGKRFLSEIYQLEGMTVSLNCVPLSNQEGVIGCVTTFQDITQIQEEEEKIRKKLHEKGFVVKYTFENIICADNAMMHTVKMAGKFAQSESNLFIYGETGTGKELFAQSIHSASRRKSGPFVAVNCAALPENLLESELFGYVEGAFTGAAKGGKKGLFELAHNGTIFLDEIGDLSLKLQARLLRVLQEKEIMRLGDGRVIPVNVRVISASNKELYQAVEAGQFREDLLYRLNVLCLSVPPVRERGKDILLLLNHYIKRTKEKTGCILCGIDKEAEEAVMEYPWPGNVRELRNFCERLSVFCETEYAGKTDVMTALYSGGAYQRKKEKGTAVCDGRKKREKGRDEKEELLEALETCRYSRKKTAAFLEIDTSTLYRKLKKYNIPL